MLYLCMFETAHVLQHLAVFISVVCVIHISVILYFCIYKYTLCCLCSVLLYCVWLFSCITHCCLCLCSVLLYCVWMFSCITHSAVCVLSVFCPAVLRLNVLLHHTLCCLCSVCVLSCCTASECSLASHTLLSVFCLCSVLLYCVWMFSCITHSAVCVLSVFCPAILCLIVLLHHTLCCLCSVCVLSCYTVSECSLASHTLLSVCFLACYTVSERFHTSHTLLSVSVCFLLHCTVWGFCRELRLIFVISFKLCGSILLWEVVMRCFCDLGNGDTLQSRPQKPTEDIGKLSLAQHGVVAVALLWRMVYKATLNTNTLNEQQTPQTSFVFCPSWNLYCVLGDTKTQIHTQVCCWMLMGN